MKTQILNEIFGGGNADCSISAIYLKTLIENTSDAIFIKSALDLKYVLVNEAFENNLGYSASEVLGHTDESLFPRRQFEFFASKDRTVINESKVVETAEEPVASKKRGIRWWKTKKIPILGKDGNVEYILGISEDITSKKYIEKQKLFLSLERTARLKAEQETKKMKFLVDAGEMLSTTLDCETAVSNLSELIVPDFADWYIVHTTTENDLKTVCICNKESIEVPKAKKQFSSAELEIALRPSSHIREGFSEIIIDTLKDTLKSKTSNSEEKARTLKKLNLKSYISIPLKAHKRVLGALTIARNSSAKSFDSDDVILMQELAKKIAITIDISNHYAESQRLNRIKDDFFATMSHELRTPLNVILGQAELLINGDLDSVEMQFAIDAIYRNSKQQYRIINDLLDVSSILVGTVRFTPTALDPRSILYTALHSIKEAAQEKNIVITSEIHEEPIRLMADPIRLREALWNLLQNAVTFNSAGSAVKLASKIVDGNLEIVVEDKGEGISPHFLPHVFDRFTQEDPSSTRKVSGLGVGLSIVKGIVELHGGVIAISSDGKGKGTSVRLRFPILKTARKSRDVKGLRGVNWTSQDKFSQH